MMDLIVNRRSSRRRRAGMVTTLLVFSSTLCTHCQVVSPISQNAYTDFNYQGEFLGKVETVSPVLGAQVIANGSGRFTAIFLIGGLPGEGWDEKSRTEQLGSLRADAQVEFTATPPSASYSASISADGETLSGKTPSGELFSLRKVIRKSPTLGYRPMHPDTLILFDGSDLKAFAANSAVLMDSLLLPQGAASTGAVTTKTFGDFILHLEFRTPFQPFESGQRRGNSGIYLQGRYELQILDSFGQLVDRKQNPGPAAQECGAFYGLIGPSLNMCYPPLSWQTYDIEFTKAKLGTDGKTQLAPALVTVRLNGVPIHEHQQLLSNTLLGDSVKAVNGPLRFQAHGDSVLFRNIWIVESSGTAVQPAPRLKPGRARHGFRHEEVTQDLSLISGRRAGGALSSGNYLSRKSRTLILLP